MIIERIQPDQRLNHPLHLGQSKGFAQSGVLGPGILERHTHGQVSPVVFHLFETGFTQVFRHHVFVLLVSRSDELGHIL